MSSPSTSAILAAAVNAAANAAPVEQTPATTSVVQRNIEHVLGVKREELGAALRAIEASQLPDWISRAR